MGSIQTDNETISLKKIIINYVYHWKLFVVAACISLVPAILYLMFYPKTYEVMARIHIQEDKALGGGASLGEAAGLMKSFGLGGGSGAAINIDDEIGTLFSIGLLTKVVMDLGLDVTYQEPFSMVRMYTESPLLVAPDSLTRQRLDGSFAFKVKAKGDGSVTIKMEDTGEIYSFSSLPAQLKLEQDIFNFSYRESADAKKAFTLKVTVSPAGWVAENLAESFTIEEYSKTSNIIEITCLDHAKKRGVDMLNVLMEEYNGNSKIIKKDEGDKAMSFLEGRIDGIMQELNNVERTIELYKIKNNMTDIEYDVQFYTESMKDLRQRIIELEAQDHVISLLDSYIKDPANKYNLIPAMMSLNNGGENGGAITVYNEALIVREKLNKTSKSNNPLQEISDSQIDKLRESVFLTIENARKSTQYILSDLKNKEKLIFNKMGQVPTYEREYLDFKRQQEILQGIYLILLQKKEEIALSLGQERDKGYILDSAFVKQLPVGPRKLYAGLFMMVFTLVIPVVYLFGKEQLLDLIKEYKISKKN